MRYVAARPETAPIDRIVAASCAPTYVATKQFTEIGYFTGIVYVLHTTTS